MVFIYASVHKIANPLAFSEAIYNYKLFPDFLINPIAIWLPWLELLAGLHLIIGLWVKGSALILSTLTLVFSIITAIAIFRGLDIVCGCFSLTDAQESIQWTHTAQNFGLLALSLYVLQYDKEENIFSILKSIFAEKVKK